MRQIEVMQSGSPVTIADDIPAKIAAISIDGHCHITYLCVWWSGSTRTEAWVEEFEVTRADDTRDMTVGFRQG
ncbi:hypothetical protein LCGC14_1986420 [marine sediment metagenome]|uniref:DUF2158 domain-containing protein n=1 Tax=marine sediment metagenome TaxID=412755 RepID=A0A0F9FVJ0_9ZZZZ